MEIDPKIEEYIEKMGEVEFAEHERELCRTDLKYLCKDVLGFQDWDICHDKLSEFLKESKKDKKMILMSRGHLKSSIVTIGVGIQEILKNPNISILYASAIWDNSRSFLRSVKEYLNGKSVLNVLFGTFASDKWTEDEIIVKQRKKQQISPTIATAGQDKALTSQHYDIEFLDDMVNRQTISSQDQLDKTWRFYIDSLDLLKKPNGILYLIGTRWDDGDIYGLVEDKLKDSFDIFTLPAIIPPDIKNIDNCEVQFKKKFSKESLKDLYAHKGSYEFSCQYLLQPIPKDSRHFPDPVRYWELMPDNVGRIITVDLGIDDESEIDEGRDPDNTAIVQVNRIKTGQRLVADYQYGHFSYDKIIDKIFTMISKNPQSGNINVGIESVAYQKIFIKLLENEQKKRGIQFKVIPIKQHVAKFQRIMVLQPLWENGNLLLKPGMVELEEELKRFPRGKHDDLLDAVAMSEQMPEPVYVSMSGQMQRQGWVHPHFQKQEQREIINF